jgi:iron(III) transport system substrate-binding protein
VDDGFARPIVEQFEKDTGIKARLITDTEETKSTGLENRLIAEKNRPQADVFWSGDPVRTAVLKAKGVSAPYQSPGAKGLPSQYSDPEGHWTGFSARAKIVIYNTNKVSPGQEPKSVLDLLDGRFKNKACIANPLFGTTSMYAVALFDHLGEEKAKEFFDKFAANGGKIVSSNGEVQKLVAAGTYEVGLTDTDDYNEARSDGKPVGIVYPDGGPNGIGTVIVPNCAMLVAGAPHGDAARRFIDYLLKPETEEALARGGAAQMPLRPGVPTPEEWNGKGLKPIDQLKPMPLHYGKLADLLEQHRKGFLKEWVDRNP